MNKSYHIDIEKLPDRQMNPIQRRALLYQDVGDNPLEDFVVYAREKAIDRLAEMVDWGLAEYDEISLSVEGLSDQVYEDITAKLVVPWLQSTARSVYATFTVKRADMPRICKTQDIVNMRYLMEADRPQKDSGFSGLFSARMEEARGLQEVLMNLLPEYPLVKLRLDELTEEAFYHIDLELLHTYRRAAPTALGFSWEKK